MEPVYHPITIQRGNSVRYYWAFVRQTDQTSIFDQGDNVVLYIKWKGGFITKSSASADPNFTLDVATGEVTWKLTKPESRSIPLGQKANYELEWQDADQSEEKTLVEGPITGKGGFNDD